MPKVLLVFCDGVGIGKDDPGINPFARYRASYLPFFHPKSDHRLPYAGRLCPTRADMGVPGLPQSATGQTALFCGVNSVRAVGRHISGLPTPTLRKLIDAHSIFLKLRHAGLTGTFANALSHEYFERLGERISASTRAQQAGGFPPRMLTHLHERRAVSHDLTNAFLRRRGHNVPTFTETQSATILAEISTQADFCLFEYILSDQAGHAQDFSAAETVIAGLQIFLNALLSALDLDRHTVVLTSDHGNMEDLSVKTHTANPVPTCIWGAGRDRLACKIARIEEVTPAILTLFA